MTGFEQIKVNDWSCRCQTCQLMKRIKKENEMNETAKKNYPAKKEKEALNQIRKIVDGLGEVSHVRAAMDGVLEMAEDNIRKGIYCSPKKTIEAMQQREESLKKTIQTMQNHQKANADIELDERMNLYKKMEIQEIDINKTLEMLDATMKSLENVCCCLKRDIPRIRKLVSTTFYIIHIYMTETEDRKRGRQDR